MIGDAGLRMGKGVGTDAADRVEWSGINLDTQVGVEQSGKESFFGVVGWKSYRGGGLCSVMMKWEALAASRTMCV